MAYSTVELDALAAGDDIATDLISGVHYQRAKISWGAVGVATEVSAATPMPVVTSAPTTGAAELTKAIDAASGGSDVGIAGLAVRDDTLSTLTPVDGDYVPFRTNSLGAQWVAVNGTVTVDGSGVTQPISGTVTANLSATDNAVLDAIVTGQLSDGHAVAATLGAETTKVIGTVNQSGAATSGATAFDSYTQVAINLTTGADQSLVAAPGASKQIWVYGVAFTCSADATTVSFQDSADLPLSGVMSFGQYGGMAVSPCGNFEMPIWKLATNVALEVDIVTGDVDGFINYAIVSV